MSAPDNVLIDAALCADIGAGQCAHPFAVLGQHAEGNDSVVRTFQPEASAVTVIAEDGRRVALEPVGDKGVFAGRMQPAAGRYRLSIYWHDKARASSECIDPYSLPSSVGELDRHLFNEGTHQQLYELLGSQPMNLEGISGTRFTVWAPNAKRVSVVGPFNNWDGRCHIMRLHPGSGIWDFFLPEIGNGGLYKYEIVGPEGNVLPLKNDPFAHYFEQAPGNASIVFQSHFEWQDQEWMQYSRDGDPRQKPISIYEVHAGSWRRKEGNQPLSWIELADQLIPYATEQCFTHIELMPVTEHPFDGSWGYQPVGLYAPTSRFGSPDDFRHFVDRCHRAGVGVIMDWVPAHFPTDDHGLGQFDGTHLYEHADPRQGFHQDWNTLIFNYGRREVVNYLLSNAVYWIREFHLDGLRVDAVASMLYLDYSREEGQWIPNYEGGRENLEAMEFLKRMNELVHAEGGLTYAEESTSFPKVSRPTYDGGLGFTFKWNMGWMHDTLEYMQKDPAFRRYHHDSLTFGLLYAFSENFVLPFSHDEVVHGKGSMIQKMPGDDWQKFANLRALYGMMWTYPGKKLNFMGSEFAQWQEWQHEQSLDWHLLDFPSHNGMLALIRELNALYKARPSLHATDCDGRGFEWIDCTDADQSVIAWYRRADGAPTTITIMNLTPVIRNAYRIGVDHAGAYRELLNTDDSRFGGSGQQNDEKGLTADDIAAHGRPASLSIMLPPLSALVLEAQTS